MLLICKLASAGRLVSVPGTSFAVHLERDPTKGADMTHQTQTEASFSQRAVGTRTLSPSALFSCRLIDSATVHRTSCSDLPVPQGNALSPFRIRSYTGPNGAETSPVK